MASFATPADLATRLGITFAVGAETTQAQAWLDDATAFLQAELGQLIEAGTATYTTRHYGCGPIRLPQQPVTEVTTVLVDDVATTDFDFVDQELWIPARRGSLYTFDEFDDRQPYADVTITFDYGYATIPAELKAWCCVLAAQVRDASLGGTLGAPRVRSEEIDDYSVTYVTDGSTAMSLPGEVLERLRARYGAGVYVTGR